MKKTRLVFLGLCLISACARPQRPHEGPSVGHFLNGHSSIMVFIAFSLSNCCGVVDIFLTD